MSGEKLPNEIKTQAIDYVTSATKAALGAVPFAGSLLAEVAGSIIPNQRIDRIADFAFKLQERIEQLEVTQVRSELENEEFTDLLEESLRQASRATSEARRQYLASLVANSLNSNSIEHAESKHLMRILGELNDVEVLWLRFFNEPTMEGDKKFRKLHSEVFKYNATTIGSSQEDLDANALRESYKDHLVRLGLITEHIRKNRDGTPEYDKFTGNPAVSYRKTNLLGIMLLRSIGMIADE
ncbi:MULTISPECIES: hypothetical protein [unclassified Pseudomonas]|uniref:Abi-alpha family protein n=1 Tax=unclassified Pseudomonas TaxID=196821 RepID=UPI000876CA32|nr:MULTISPECIES: hypothetical protein [unclassified Pseudomonas]SCZ23990.1 hypothetical protein SAMN03159405_01069 [Pseudomonas sp. NFACC44-2]SDA67185.1 hypothetical protein SAMN03159429_02700 [Pseudomonas sp. NFACC51]SFJ54223.1 hypothetical protein SAMN03159302_06038 [Pseudomonas sp. NFACC54]SFS56969.1 hypothetical protein SAMN03159306_01196 [Pseudomonas sp. NFACC48-1]